MRPQNVGKHVESRELSTGRGGDVQANGAGKLSVEVNAKNRDIPGVIEGVGKRLARVGLDGAFAHIGLITQLKYRVFFLRGFDPTVVDAIEQLHDSVHQAKAR